MTMEDQSIRERLYSPMREEGIFTWDRMYGEEYALADIHLISRSFRQELAEATRLLGDIFAKVAPVLQQSDDVLLRELGVPEPALDAVRTVILQAEPTVIGRFDFVHTQDGLKMLEYNSDTPTGIVEAFYVNGNACRFFGWDDPNAGMEAHIGSAYKKVLDAYRQDCYQTEHIWFSSLDWHEEDKGTTLYLLRQSGLSARFAALEQLRVWRDGLYVKDAEEMLPIHVLYRLHALEKLAFEQDEDGYPTGEHVLQLIADRKLAIINPPSAFLLQTKALQALIWSLHENEVFFTPSEREVIADYMLPTYFENRFTADYVTKPIFGREGGGVVLYDANGQVLEEDPESMYGEQPVIYQKRVELPVITVNTEAGPYEGRLLWGSFLIGGRESAIVARVGGRITDNLSYYLPVGMQK